MTIAHAWYGLKPSRMAAEKGCPPGSFLGPVNPQNAGILQTSLKTL
jgi:hypothetical protein